MDPWLHVSVIILHIVDEFAKTPEDIGFYFHKLFWVYLLYIFLTDLVDIVLVKVRN
jgi:hypothetical protein